MAVDKSRKKTTMLGSLNHTFLSLIPEKRNAQAMGDYRLTSLINTMYMIVTKVMTNRLKEVISRIISIMQRGFLHMRLIKEGIIVLHEVIHLKPKKREAGIVKILLILCF